MKITPRERLLRALRFENVDMIPIMAPWGEAFLEDESIPIDKRKQLKREMEINPRAVSMSMYKPVDYGNGRDQWGVLWKDNLDIDHPIKEWDDLLEYQFPEVQPDLFFEQDTIEDEGSKASAECRKGGDTVLFGGSWQIITFERYRTLRGFENCLTDLILYPDKCLDLISRIEQYNLRLIKRWVELGCDIIGFSDDLGSMRQMLMKPETWRRFYKLVYRRMCQLIHEGGAKTWMHSDGAIASIIPDLVEIGLDILDPVQAECIDIKQLSKEYRGRLVIWGGLDSHIIATGTYETVRKHVCEAIEIFQGFEGGMVGTITNYLFPSIDVPLAMYHAFRNVC